MDAHHHHIADTVDFLQTVWVVFNDIQCVCAEMIDDFVCHCRSDTGHEIGYQQFADCRFATGSIIHLRLTDIKERSVSFCVSIPSALVYDSCTGNGVWTMTFRHPRLIILFPFDFENRIAGFRVIEHDGGNFSTILSPRCHRIIYLYLCVTHVSLSQYNTK